jgi:hypothetical protein
VLDAFERTLAIFEEHLRSMMQDATVSRTSSASRTGADGSRAMEEPRGA